jgi:hypothetical protein
MTTKTAAEAPTLTQAAAPEEPAETRYPTDPSEWRSRHFLALLGRFERAWDACPESKRHILRPMVLELVGAESSKQGSLL